MDIVHASKRSELPELPEIDFSPMGAAEVECVTNGPIETNTYFIYSGAEAVVVDPAWDGEVLARGFMERHPGVKIVAIICTHGHGDHVGGVAGMRRVLGEEVPYLISRVDADYVPAAVESMKAMWGIENEFPGDPTDFLGEGDVVGFGGCRLQVIEAPGHTRGGIVLFGAMESGNVAFVGDTLFPGGHGRTDLEGGDEAQIISSLGRIGAALPEDTACYIGHGATTTIAEERLRNLFMRRSFRRMKKHHNR